MSMTSELVFGHCVIVSRTELIELIELSSVNRFYTFLNGV
jgi:hypothetical protein